MSETPEAKPEGDKKAKAPGSPNKLLIIMALTNTLGVFGLGGFLVYDKMHASHAAAQASSPAGDKKGGEHGEKAEEKGEEGHGEKAEEGEKGEEGHGEKAEGDHAEGEEEPTIESKGPIMALESIVTNLSEPDTDRYLKLTIQLQVTSEAAKAEVEAHLVPVRSQILMHLSALNMADVVGPDKRRTIAKQLRRIANDAMPSSRIRNVYFTEFVIQ